MESCVYCMAKKNPSVHALHILTNMIQQYTDREETPKGKKDILVTGRRKREKAARLKIVVY